jgi:hypothetical protein
LPFFSVFHIFSLFNLFFFHISHIFSLFNSPIERRRGVLHNISENTRKKGGKTQLPVADGRTEQNPLRGHVTDVTSDSTNTSHPTSNANWAVPIYFLRHLVNNGAIHIYVHDYIRMDITVLYLKISRHQLSI